MVESIGEFIKQVFGESYWGVFFIAMLPIVELRLAVPFGVGMGFPILPTLLVAIAGNIFPVPFLIFFSQKVLRWLATFKRIGPFFQKIIDKASRKAGEIGDKELLGLFFFVCIPLPGTGAWTGSLVSAILQLDWKKSILVIIAGVITAGIIMTLLSAIFGSMFGWDLSLR